MAKATPQTPGFKTALHPSGTLSKRCRRKAESIDQRIPAARINCIARHHAWVSCAILLLKNLGIIAVGMKWLPVVTCASVAVVGLMPISASAFQTVVVGDKTYEVSKFFGSYNSNKGKFTAAEMPWFGSQGLARDFATAVGNKLGVGFFGQGPLFAYTTLGVFGTVSTINAINIVGITISPLPIFSTLGVNYAIAKEVVPPPAPPTESVPAPLPLMGAGVAFGFSRRLRSRIQRSTNL